MKTRILAFLLATIALCGCNVNADRPLEDLANYGGAEIDGVFKSVIPFAIPSPGAPTTIRFQDGIALKKPGSVRPDRPNCSVTFERAKFMRPSLIAAMRLDTLWLPTEGDDGMKVFLQKKNGKYSFQMHLWFLVPVADAEKIGWERAILSGTFQCSLGTARAVPSMDTMTVGEVMSIVGFEWKWIP